MSNKNKKRDGVVYSTNPDFKFSTNDADEIETIPGNGNVISVSLGHHAIETFKLIL